ncbi:MAG: acyl-CoA dehydrogenase family protein [Pseudomonadales bacterium]
MNEADPLQAVAAVREIIIDGREAAERTGCLGDAVVAALRRAGVFRLYLPRSLGGLEVDPVTCARVTEAIARCDSAAAWYVMVGNAAKLMAAAWPRELAEEVLGADPDVLVAASGNRPFLAVAGQRDGEPGFLLSGRNGFVSGCRHARWLLSPIQIGSGPDAQRRTALVPMAAATIVDNWDTLGMRGTGSNDVTLEQVWVPARHTVAMADPAAGAVRNAHYQGTLYRCSGRVVFATYVPVTLVLAEQALAALQALAVSKTPYASEAALASRESAQRAYGEALGIYRAAHGYFYAELEAAWNRACAGEEAQPKHRADLYLAGTHAVQSSARVVRLVADAAASSVIYADQPLQRVLRDMETLRHHGFVSPARFANVAQIYWDVPLTYPLLLR